MRGVSPDGRNTVQGTFDDLSEEEKTRAYLQFLQYHQQLEQKNQTKKFQRMLNKDHRDLGAMDSNNNSDENEIDDSINGWTGGTNSSNDIHGPNIRILMYIGIMTLVFHIYE